MRLSHRPSYTDISLLDVRDSTDIQDLKIVKHQVQIFREIKEMENTEDKIRKRQEKSERKKERKQEEERIKAEKEIMDLYDKVYSLLLSSLLLLQDLVIIGQILTSVGGGT